MAYLHTMEYFASIKRIVALTHVTMRMSLENIRLHGRHQPQRTTDRTDSASMKCHKIEKSIETESRKNVRVR